MNYDYIYATLAPRADKKVLARGKAVYADGCIESLTLSPSGKFTAEVAGSEGDTYAAYIKVKSSAVQDFGCDCPYDWGDVCKHLVAMALAIQNGEFEQPQPKVSKQKEQNLDELLQKVDPDKLRKFILRYAENDAKFRSELRFAFGQPDMALVMEETKTQVKAIMTRRIHYGHIEWRDCDAICDDFEDILDKTGERLAQGHVLTAFSVAMFVLLKCVRMASIADSSSGALTMAIGHALEIIEQACAAARTPADQKQIYDTCVKEARNKVFEGWDDWNYTFLRSAAHFVNAGNAKKMYDTLDFLFARQKYPEYAQADDRLTRLEVIKHLEGESAYDAYVDANLDVREIRKIAVTHAIEKKDYPRAEQLCLAYLEEKEKSPYQWTKEWYGLLYDIYTKTDRQRQMELAEKLLLKEHDLTFYDALKDLHGAGWPEEYPMLRERCAQRLPPGDYMQILRAENEAALLLEEVRKNQRYIFAYGTWLAGHFPTEAYCIFWDEIKAQAEQANGRGDYRKVCGNLKMLAEAGGREDADALIELLRQRNPRRPALLEELANLEARLAKGKK